MRAWNIDNTARRHAPLSLQAAGGIEIGATAEGTSRRFDDTTRLRPFCRRGRKTPLVTVVFQPGSRDTALGQKTSRPDDVLSMLETSTWRCVSSPPARVESQRASSIASPPPPARPFQPTAVLEISGVSFQELEAVGAVTFADVLT